MQYTLQNKKSGTGVGEILLFLISPVMMLLLFFKRYDHSKFKNILWLFIIFYGFTFVISNEGLDSNRYYQELETLANENPGLDEFSSRIYTGSYTDILQPYVTFFLSKVTTNSHWLFAVFGFIYGFFYSRNIAMLIELIPPAIRKRNWFFLLLFAMIIPIWQINGFRMWTATHLFVFAFLKYHVTGNKKALLLIPLTFLVHWSLLIVNAVFLIYYILGKRKNLYFIFFAISFFINELPLPSFSVISAPAAFEKKITDYTNEDYLESVDAEFQQVNWYVKYRSRALRITLIILIILSFLQLRNSELSKFQLDFLCFTMYFTAVVNIMGTLQAGSLDRFNTLANLLMVGFLCTVPRKSSGMKFTYILGNAVFLLYVAVEMRIGLDTMSLDTLLSNPVISLIYQSQVPLIDIIK